MRRAITEDMLVRAYRAGIFPMAASRESGSLSWYDPDPRGILPLDRFHLSRRLFRTVRIGRYEVTVDTAFDRVIAECAAPADGREESWISTGIAELFRSLHRRPVDGARAHSVECWMGGEGTDSTPILVGGLYGLRIGRAFFGESMFSRARDASKVALVHLVARLRLGGFTLLDTQFITDHLAQFGAIELPREAYHALLERAVRGEAGWIAAPPSPMLSGALAELAVSGHP